MQRFDAAEELARYDRRDSQQPLRLPAFRIGLEEGWLDTVKYGAYLAHSCWVRKCGFDVRPTPIQGQLT